MTMTLWCFFSSQKIGLELYRKESFIHLRKLTHLHIFMYMYMYVYMHILCQLYNYIDIHIVADDDATFYCWLVFKSMHTHIHPHPLNRTSFSLALANILCRISHEMLRSQLYAKKAMKQRVFRPCAYILKPPLYLKIATLFWPRARRLLPAQCNIPRSPLACLGFEPHPAFKSSLYPPGGMCHSLLFPLG